jgi:hypothetical protein
MKRRLACSDGVPEGAGADTAPRLFDRRKRVHHASMRAERDGRLGGDTSLALGGTESAGDAYKSYHFRSIYGPYGAVYGRMCTGAYGATHGQYP